MAVLRIQNGTVAGRILTMQKRVLTIGRSLANDYQIPDPTVSDTHCEVWLDGSGRLNVRDRDSMEGTFVDGQRITEGLIKIGQSLRLGNIELIFENNSPALLPSLIAPAKSQPPRPRDIAPLVRPPIISKVETQIETLRES